MSQESESFHGFLWRIEHRAPRVDHISLALGPCQSSPCFLTSAMYIAREYGFTQEVRPVGTITQLNSAFGRDFTQKSCWKISTPAPSAMEQVEIRCQCLGKSWIERQTQSYNWQVLSRRFERGRNSNERARIWGEKKGGTLESLTFWWMPFFMNDWDNSGKYSRDLVRCKQKI